MRKPNTLRRCRKAAAFFYTRPTREILSGFIAIHKNFRGLNQSPDRVMLLSFARMRVLPVYLYEKVTSPRHSPGLI
jgi:hypothetical protein